MNSTGYKIIIVLFIIIFSMVFLSYAADGDTPKEFQPVIGSWVRDGYRGGCVLDVKRVDLQGNMRITYTPPTQSAQVRSAIAKLQGGKIKLFLKLILSEIGELKYELAYDKNSNKLIGKDNLVIEEVSFSKQSPRNNDPKE